MKKIVLTCCLLFTIGVSAELVIQATHDYDQEISGPSVVEVCGNNLWVYSVGAKSIYEMDPDSGSVLHQTGLSQLHIQGTITALGCMEQKLVLASFLKDSHEVSFHSLLTPITVSSRRLPGHEWVRDIFCRGLSCYLIRDKIYHSRDLKKWDEVQIPSSANIPKRSLQKEALFSNWQDQFLVAQGSYFRGWVTPNDKLLLLDSIRSAIVTYEPHRMEKWESWGFRRGNLLFPKGFAVLNNNVIAISDVGLKLISFFDLNGQYLGSVGADGPDKRFGYPLDIAVSDNRLFVIDFFKNTLSAFDIKFESLEKKDIPKLIHENLFRHPEVSQYFSETRCLNCHDGLETYNLERFLNLKDRSQHPLYKEIQKQIDLPLGTKNKMDCFSCHHSHHEAPPGKTVSQFGNIQSVSKLPYQFRKSIPELCLECHAEKGLSDQNHFRIKRDRLSNVKAEQVVACTQCHKMHQSHKHLLKKDVVALCTTCHGKTQVPQSHPLQEGEKEVTCLSCHTTHDVKKEFHFARSSGKASREVCLECHKNRKPMMGFVEHLKVDPKVDRAKWPGDEVVCLKCHHPHDPKPKTMVLCISCHKDRKEAHHEKNIEKLFKRADLEVSKNIVLESGKLSCATCHDPHNLANLENYLRPRQSDIKAVCAMCHSEDGMDQRFKDYHKRQKVRHEGGGTP